MANQFNDTAEQERRYFDHLVNQVRGMDSSVVRDINSILHTHLFPEQQGTIPQEGGTTRGRPRNSSTRREPSGFERTGRGNGRRGGGRRRQGRGYGRNTDADNVRARPPPHPNAPQVTMICEGSFPHTDRLPAIILPFMTGFMNPTADGNCGFRCIADAYFGGQDNWVHARAMVAREIMNYPNLYGNIYAGVGGIHVALQRIQFTDPWGAGEHHWLDATTDFNPIASMFNCAILYYMLTDNGSWDYCTTILPLYAPRGVDRPYGTLAIAFLGWSHRHFVRLFLDDGVPCGPIPQAWYNNRENSVLGWEDYLAEGRQLWDDYTN